MKRFFITAMSLLLAVGVYAQLLNENPGFESGSFYNEWKLSAQNTDDAVVEIVTNPVRSGNYALHIQHQYVNGSSHNRCEIVSKAQLGTWTSISGYADWNKEYWLGFSVYLENWTNTLGDWNSIVQNHSVPHNYNWGVCDAGHNNWSFSADNGIFAYNTFGRPNFNIIASLVSNPAATPGIGAIGDRPWATDIENVNNRWVDVVINWVTSDGSDGKFRIWVDGVLVVEMYGANHHTNDNCGLPRERTQIITFGSYKSPNTTNRMSMYFDEIRFADSRGSYELVAPGGSAAPPSSTKPVLNPIGNQTISVGSQLNIPLSATDLDGDNLTFSISPDQPFIALTDNGNGTGNIRVSPADGQTGTYYVDVIVTDETGNIDSEMIIITVEDAQAGNNQPVLSPIGSKSLMVGEVQNFVLNATDADGDALSYSISPQLDFVSLNDNGNGTANLTIVPADGDVGTHTVTVIVTDSNNSSDAETFLIYVNSTAVENSAPVLIPVGSQTINAEMVRSIPLSTTDPDGDAVTYSISPNLSFLSLTDNQDGSAILTLSPGANDVGTYNLDIIVSDPYDNYDSELIIITVNEPVVGETNSPPILNPVGSRLIYAGDNVGVNLSASDSDGDAISFSLNPANPSFANLIDNQDGTGLLNFSPTVADEGVHSIDIIVTDEHGESDSEMIQVTVQVRTQPNNQPILSSVGNHSVTEGSNLTIPISSSDSDGDPLTLSVSPDISFITLTDNNNGTGVLTVSPGNGTAGSYNITVIVTDSKNSSDSEGITITVIDRNTVPILTHIGDQSLAEGEVLYIPISSYDDDGDKMRYQLYPDNLHFIELTDHGTGTGLLKIAPLSGDAGSYSLTLKVIDERNQSDSEVFQVLINRTEAGNMIPILSELGDQLVREGESISINLKAIDGDDNQLTYSLSTSFDFISLIDNNDGTGILNISPNPGDAGKYTIKVTVTDSYSGTDTKSFTLIVESIDNPKFANFINSGGKSVAYGSMLAQEDIYYNGGSTNVRPPSYTIEGTDADDIYRSVRYGTFGYDIPVPQNGLYIVRLHFAELGLTEGDIGKRIFNVDIEDGQERLINYDINADVGPKRAVVKTYTGIKVQDGSLSIDLETVMRNAIISGIEIIHEADEVTAIDDKNQFPLLSLYPNPSTGLFNIELLNDTNHGGPVLYHIYDISGKIILQSWIKGRRETVDLTGKRKGMYILKVGEDQIRKLFIH